MMKNYLKKQVIGVMLSLLSTSVFALTPWQKVTHPIAGKPQVMGQYANGCLVGAEALPLEASDYQVMRPDQQRYFGHPDLLAFIERLAQQTHQQSLGTLLIGDMAMPAGGRFSSGHASHQSGLDVDIWLQLPRQRWSAAQLLSPQPIDLVASDGKQVVAKLWQPHIANLIKLAAKDSEVARIFVNPAIKKRLCEDAGNDREWLRKVRPWFEHRAHMHVRLHCPPDSPLCQEQDQIPVGDGCGSDLSSWFIPHKPGASSPKSAPPPLFPACQALLDHHFNAE